MALINYKCAKCGMITPDVQNETSSCTVTDLQSATPNDHTWVAANDQSTDNNPPSTGNQNPSDPNAGGGNPSDGTGN